MFDGGALATFLIFHVGTQRMCRSRDFILFWFSTFRLAYVFFCMFAALNACWWMACSPKGLRAPKNFWKAKFPGGAC